MLADDKAMNAIIPSHFPRSPKDAERAHSLLSLLVCASVATLLGINVASAAFHLWTITEVYSSADGTVQFIQLNANAANQEFMHFGASIHSTNSLGTNSVSLITDLPGDSLNHTMIIGTSNLLSIPGGLKPDYFIPNGFILPPVAGGNAAVTYSASVFVITNLPTDGDLALLKSGTNVTTGTNLMVNFGFTTNTIVPVRFNSSQLLGPNLVMTFPTATGTNGSAGPLYTVEYKNLFTDSTWTSLTSVQGDGTIQSVSNATSSASQQFFRLNVP